MYIIKFDSLVGPSSISVGSHDNAVKMFDELKNTGLNPVWDFA